jgi:8-oxo-dGTP pyrophosphatase MutT (NUDIX family)
MREPACVGAVVRDERNRVYAHRRAPDRRLLPGIWDIIGGHLEVGETPQQALARELQEETGWRLRHVQAVIADWEWEHGGVVRRELDYLVEVDGDLDAPRLETGKHDAYAWVGADNLELMMQGRRDGDHRLRDIVAKAVRMRLTERLRLEPIGPGHAQDLWRLHYDDAVAAWHGGQWTAETAHRRAAAMGQDRGQIVGLDERVAGQAVEGRERPSRRLLGSLTGYSAPKSLCTWWVLRMRWTPRSAAAMTSWRASPARLASSTPLRLDHSGSTG